MPCEQVHCHDARSMSCWQKVQVVSVSQYFQIVNLVDCLSSWYKFILNNPSNIKKSWQHCFDSWFGLTEFCWSWGISSLPLCTWLLHFRVILVDPCFITCDDMAQMSSCLSKRSWQIVTLLCFCFSVSSFGTIFAHTFLMSRSSVKIFLFLCLCSLVLLCSWQSADNFHTQFDEFFPQFCLLLAILTSLHQWHFLFPQKNVSPTCKLLFSSWHYPHKLALTSLWFRFRSFQV